MNCDICGQECYRRSYQRQDDGTMRWVDRHEKCEPNKPRYERRHAPGSKAPMGYVPSNYKKMPIQEFIKSSGPSRGSR